MLRVRFRRNWWVWLTASLVISTLVFAGSAFRQAAQARSLAKTFLTTGSGARFSTVTLDTSLPSGIEPVASPAAFVDFTTYQDRLWTSGPAGLYSWNRDGSPGARYRPGLELPAVELGEMSVGIDGGPKLFIATHGEGLLEFDGQSFRSIRSDDPSVRTLTCVLALSTGRVLFGTEKRGVLLYDGKGIASLSASLAGEHVTALAGTESNLWIGTLTGGVWHSHAGQLERFKAPDALPDPQVLSLAVSGDVAWVGTPLGVVEFRSGKRTRQFADGFFARSLAGDGSVLWVGTEDEGVFEVPLAGLSRSQGTGLAHSLAATVERVQMLQGDVLALTSAGLLVRREGSWQPVASLPGALLTDRNISALTTDSSGRLWVGYFDRGLDIVNAAFDRVTHREDGHVFCVNRIVAAPDQQRIAVATANGLVFFDAGGTIRQVVGRRQGLLSDHVSDLTFHGNTLIAATPAGLSFLAPDGIRNLYAFQGLVNNHVYAVAADGTHLMAGTLGGLSVVQDGVVHTSYTTANSHLRHNWITAVVKVGDQWFAGTYGAGVLALDPDGEWHSFPDLNPSLVINPGALAVSSTSVYAGSLGDGLYVYDRARRRWSRSATGLPSLNVTALTLSGGYLYTGTDNGLVRMREEAVR